MVDFRYPIKLPKMEDRTCTKCGQDFRGSHEVCSECHFNETHPEMAPGYWTWRSSATGWKIQAKWREKESWPEPGTVVTVHRKNGTASQETIAEVENNYFDRAANLVLVCRVEGG